MTYFEQALLAPELHFKHLRPIEPILCNGRPIIRRSTNAIEAEVLWRGRKHLLYLPFRNDSLIHIEEIESAMRERRRGPTFSNQIFYGELLMVDSIGRSEYFDIILQEIPKGMTFTEAVEHYRADDIRSAIRKMKSELNAIGFCHNNLRPTNIGICDNGIACPLRYWYAEIDALAENNISLLEAHIDNRYNAEADSLKKPLFAQEQMGEESAPSTSEGITRICRGNRYGFKFYDGSQIAPFIYTWASDFSEGRAVVARNGKMGAINNRGEKVIPVIYKELTFDVKSGTFTATRDKYRYLIDYDGKIIRRTTIDNE